MEELDDNKPEPVSPAQLHYAFDGKTLSQVWEEKLDAHAIASGYHAQKLDMIRRQVQDGQVSPLAYYIHKNMLTVGMLAAYTGIPKRHVKKHLKLEPFNRLSDEELKKYADVFEISTEKLKKV